MIRSILLSVSWSHHVTSKEGLIDVSFPCSHGMTDFINNGTINKKGKTLYLS